jgi:Flp pilus assembly protein TadD
MMTEKSVDSLESDVLPLLRKIAEGKVILFLGSGINKGCLNSKGQDAPLGNELALLIKERFFPDEEVPTDLETICQCVEAEESRRTLDRFIYDIFIDYKPSNVLKQIPRLRWRRIYTTNFDRLLEQAYDEVRERAQNLYPIYSDWDIQAFQLGQDVPYSKLHGCITKISSRNLRLVLTPEDYASYRENRKRLFGRLQDDLFDHTILFVGYSLTDRNFQALFYEVQSDMDVRDFPRCYAISPNMPRAMVNAWDIKKIKVLNLTASEFFALAAETPITPYLPPQEQREEVAVLTEQAAPKLGLAVASDLLKAFEFVDDRLGYEEPDYGNFYRGNRPSWAVIRAGCDAGRTFYEQIIDDVLLVEEAEKPDPFEIAVITAEAGAGKTTLLMRLAYDHACSFEGFCLFHRTFRSISIEALEELHRVVKKRIYIYMDDAADNIASLAFLARRARALDLPITVVCAERRNEWNGVKDRLYPIIPIEYDLPYLDDEEIDKLLQVLERNDYLCELSNKSIEERRTTFKEKAEKQLLVAMREATEGKEFDRIIEDEYDSIPSELGRRAYLHICSLHRLGVPVRAGLLRRLSGVSFTDFQKKLLQPCERVICVEHDNALDEYLYRARHPHIAEIVCRYALGDGESVASVYLEILSKMDLGYASDAYSFRQLVRADSIIDAMPGINHRRRFYDQALLLSHGDAYVYQQYGLMELRHGNLDEAENYMGRACKLEPRNQAYKHSYARLMFENSLNAQNPAQKDRLFREAQKTLSDVMRDWPTNPYAYDSYAQNLIHKADEVDEPLKEDHLKEAHEVLLSGIRRCPDKSYLQATDAKIFEKLGEYEYVKRSLFTSHHSDPTSVRTALLLGRFLVKEGEHDSAAEVISEALKYNEDHEALNLLAAEVAMSISPQDHTKIIGFLKKTFDPDYIDSEANFLLAVEYFRAERFDEAEEIFRGFRWRKAYKKDSYSFKVREFITDEQGNKRQFEGQVKIVYRKNGYITPDLIPVDIYFLPSQCFGIEIKRGVRVGFTIGFNLFGPIAQNIFPK